MFKDSDDVAKHVNMFKKILENNSFFMSKTRFEFITLGRQFVRLTLVLSLFFRLTRGIICYYYMAHLPLEKQLLFNVRFPFLGSLVLLFIMFFFLSCFFLSCIILYLFFNDKLYCYSVLYNALFTGTGGRNEFVFRNKKGVVYK